MVDVMQRGRDCIVGALVADAASMGLHWLYDAARIRQVAPDAPEFLEPNASNYEGVAGYYAHGGKRAGEPSNYGAQLRVALASMAATRGVWQPDAFLERFVADFERGGRYVGYIDHSTRQTLDIASTHKAGTFLGAVDDQMPAFSKLLPIIVAYCGDPKLPSLLEPAIRLTNNHDLAVAYGCFGAMVVERVLLGASIDGALRHAIDTSDPMIRDVLREAVSLGDASPNAITEHFGASCEVSKAFPVSVALLNQAKSYSHGVRANIYGGGDSCGRALFVGAVLAAQYGVGEPSGIPASWIDRLAQQAAIMTELNAMFARND